MFKKFTYIGSSVSSTEKDIDTRLTEVWAAIDMLSIIWKSDLTDKMKRSFFQAAVLSILQYGCTTWTLKKRLEKKLDGNYTRIIRAILNKSWRQQPTRHQLYGHQPPIAKTIQARRTRHAEHCWRSKDELISDVLLMTEQKQDDQLKHTFSTYVRIRDVALKICHRRWTIGRSGERGSGISVLWLWWWWWWCSIKAQIGKIIFRVLIAVTFRIKLNILLNFRRIILVGNVTQTICIDKKTCNLIIYSFHYNKVYL